MHQIERVRDSWEQFQAVRKSWMDKGTIRVTPEMERPAAIFWSDIELEADIRRVEGELIEIEAGT